MLQLTKELLKETILLLIAINVIRLLIPRWIRTGTRRFTRLVNKGVRGTTRYARKHYTYYKQNKKATQTKIEQPSNVITIVTYPDGTKKKIYRKAK